MKLILYFGHYGSTEEAANKLSSYLSDSKVLNGSKEKIKDFSNIDTIILGTNIRADQFNRQFIKWCKKNLPKLENVKIASFSIGADSAKEGIYHDRLLQMLPQAYPIGFFGGVLNPDKAKGIYKRIIQSCIEELKKRDLDLPSLKEDKIKDFAKLIA